MSDFEKGETVRLKSGGPTMTVSDTDTIKGEVKCNWFSGAKRQKGRFEPEELERVEEDEEDG